MAEYKRNHSIPRFMLEYWVDPSTTHQGIHVYEIATQRTYVSTGRGRKPFSFAITPDLYVLHTTNGSRAVNLERWFSGLEDALAALVRRVHAREPISMSVHECMKVLMAMLGLECRSPYNMGRIRAALASDSTLRSQSSGDPMRMPQQGVMENIVSYVSEHALSFTPTEMIFYVAPSGKSWVLSDRPYMDFQGLGARLVVLTNQILVAYCRSNSPGYRYQEAKIPFLTDVNKRITLKARDWLAADSAATLQEYVSSVHSPEWHKSVAADKLDIQPVRNLRYGWTFNV